MPADASAVRSLRGIEPPRPFAREDGVVAGAFVGRVPFGKRGGSPEATDAPGLVLITVHHFGIGRATVCGRTGI